MIICVSAQIEREPAEEDLALAVETFKLLADYTRLKILWALLHGEHSVSNLADHVGAQPSAVSQHLAKLRMARLVKVRREGNRMFYAAEDDHVLGLVEQALFHVDQVTRDRADQEGSGPATAGGARRKQA